MTGNKDEPHLAHDGADARLTQVPLEHVLHNLCTRSVNLEKSKIAGQALTVECLSACTRFSFGTKFAGSIDSEPPGSVQQKAHAEDSVADCDGAACKATTPRDLSVFYCSLDRVTLTLACDPNRVWHESTASQTVRSPKNM